MRTFVYVDGFNLYYRALRNTRFKWLDLHALVSGLLAPENEIKALKYYTARVMGDRDPDQPRRQQIYFNALKAIPSLEIYFGHFLSNPKWRPLVNPPPGGNEYVQVKNTEEKGSDVNLASHLIHDGWKGEYEVAVVVSKDTDLMEPIRIVTQELKKPVGLICPDGKVPWKLERVASFIRHIEPHRLSAAQFDNPLVGRGGQIIEKPESW